MCTYAFLSGHRKAFLRPGFYLFARFSPSRPVTMVTIREFSRTIHCVTCSVSITSLLLKSPEFFFLHFFFFLRMKTLRFCPFLPTTLKQSTLYSWAALLKISVISAFFICLNRRHDHVKKKTSVSNFKNDRVRTVTCTTEPYL